MLSRSPFTLTSSAFAPGAPIPKKYTCDGGLEPVSPPLHWAAAPSGTRAFAIRVDDTDAHFLPLAWLGGSRAAPAASRRVSTPGTRNRTTSCRPVTTGRARRTTESITTASASTHSARTSLRPSRATCSRPRASWARTSTSASRAALPAVSLSRPSGPGKEKRCGAGRGGTCKRASGVT